MKITNLMSFQYLKKNINVKSYYQTNPLKNPPCMYTSTGKPAETVAAVLYTFKYKQSSFPITKSNLIRI